MLKSCPYCGKIHDKKVVCSKKPVPKKYNTDQSKFRSTSAWTKKARSIKRRDGFLCQVCLRELHGTTRKYNAEHLEVHHIIKVKDDFDLRLDDTNLITLCEHHHTMADCGEITAKELKNIAFLQENG